MEIIKKIPNKQIIIQSFTDGELLLELKRRGILSDTVINAIFKINKPFTIKQIDIKLLPIKPLTCKPFTIKPFTVKPFTIKPFTITSYNIKPYNIVPLTIKPMNIKPYAIEPLPIIPFKIKTTPIKSTPKKTLSINKNQSKIYSGNGFGLRELFHIPKVTRDIYSFKDYGLRNLYDKTANEPQIKLINTFKNVSNVYDIIEYTDSNKNEYFKNIKPLVKKRLIEFSENKPIKFQLSLGVVFTNPNKDEEVSVFFRHNYSQLNSINLFDDQFDQIAQEFDAWVDGFQERDSGFTFEYIDHARLSVIRIKTLRGNSYIKLPFISKHIINIRNEDNKCFLWSVLAHIFKTEDKQKTRVTKYVDHEFKVDMTNISYPVSIKDISKFEKQNPKYAINVFHLGDGVSKDTITPYRISKHYEDIINQKNNREMIKLLFLHNDNNNHYCLITDLAGLCMTNRNKPFLCERCMTLTSTNKALINHMEICSKHGIGKIEMPTEGSNILKFKNHHFKSKLPIVIYADFETISVPINSVQNNPEKSYTEKICQQIPYSYALKIVTDIPVFKNKFKKSYETYSGLDADDKFIERMEEINEKIGKAMNYYVKNPTPIIFKNNEKQEYKTAENCFYCNCKFTEVSYKVMDHNHYTGDYRGAACQSCNTKEGKNSKFVPVYFHNLSGYDCPLFIGKLAKKQDDHFKKLKILAKTSEEYISFDFGILRFLDSYRFFIDTLDNVAKSLNGELPLTRAEFEKLNYNNFEHKLNMLKRKGVYPYAYVTSLDVFNETKLPPIEAFNSKLKQETIKLEDYEFAQKVWKEFECKTFQDYHDLYLKVDVMLLADCFEAFRNVFLKHHEIDPCYCYSSPGLTWNCGLKFTGVSQELITDYDMLLLFEKGIRGGFSGVLGSRYIKANNKYLKDYNKDKPSNFLLHLDANNLYGYAMSQPLPTGDFRYEKNPDYYKNIPDGRGCIVVCDLKYNDETRKKTYRFPLAPLKRKIKINELSEYQKDLIDKNNEKTGNVEKLILDLHDKEEYVIHYKLLDYYIKLGLKVTKVHKTVSFKEEAWLKPYIDFNTEQRKASTTDFEKSIWKMMNNAFYGKTMENIRERTDLQLITDPVQAVKLFSKPSFKDKKIFDEDLIAIMNHKPTIVFDKPIYTGMCVLDYSKLLMYQFYYEVINEKWPNNQIIGFDTDSFFLNIATDDLYKDMKEIEEHLDMSDYPEDHELYSPINKKVIGKFKDELNSKIMSEIVFLRSKAYSYLVAGNEKKRLKGIKKATIDKQIKFQDYYNTLMTKETKYNTMNTLNSINHNMYMLEINKKSMSAFDDKRRINNDGIKTLPFSPNYNFLKIAK